MVRRVCMAIKYIIRVVLYAAFCSTRSIRVKETNCSRLVVELSNSGSEEVFSFFVLSVILQTIN